MLQVIRDAYLGVERDNLQHTCCVFAELNCKIYEVYNSFQKTFR
jgi:hypothetical protein